MKKIIFLIAGIFVFIYNIYSQKIEIIKSPRTYVGLFSNDTIYKGISKPKLVNDTTLEQYYLRSSTLLAVQYHIYGGPEMISQIQYGINLNQDLDNDRKYYIDFERNYKGLISFFLYYYDSSHGNKRKNVFKYRKKDDLIETYTLFEDIVNQLNKLNIGVKAELNKVSTENKVKIDKVWK